MKCLQCGAEFQGNFCSNCGSPSTLPEIHCLECGTSYVGNICPACGMEKGHTTKIRCVKCGTLYNGARKSCPNCGQFSAEMMKRVQLLGVILFIFILFIFIPLIFFIL